MRRRPPPKYLAPTPRSEPVERAYHVTVTGEKRYGCDKWLTGDLPIGAAGCFDLGEPDLEGGTSAWLEGGVQRCVFRPMVQSCVQSCATSGFNEASDIRTH